MAASLGCSKKFSRFNELRLFTYIGSCINQWLSEPSSWLRTFNGIEFGHKKVFLNINLHQVDSPPWNISSKLNHKRLTQLLYRSQSTHEASRQPNHLSMFSLLAVYWLRFFGFCFFFNFWLRIPLSNTIEREDETSWGEEEEILFLIYYNERNFSINLKMRSLFWF